MLLFGGKKKRAWLDEAVQKFAPAKEETYNESISGKLDVKPISTLIDPQIEYLFKQMSNKDQKWIIEDAEEKRMEVGPSMSRQSDNYFYYVAARIISFTHNQ